MTPERFRGRAGACRTAILAEVAAIAGRARALVHAATTATDIVLATLDAVELVAPTSTDVTEGGAAPGEPIACQIAGHGLAVGAMVRRRSVADSLVPFGCGGLARRLLAA